MKKHFVIFCSPGTLVSETNQIDVDSWDIQQAVNMSYDINQRHGAKPYGFYFITRERKENELDSKIAEISPMYYLGGEIRTYEQVCTDNKPEEETLRFNMRVNNYNRIIVNTNSWKFTAPLKDEDVVLSYDKERLINAN